MSIVVWLLIGLVAGFLARALVPGRDPMGILGTLVLGLVGSMVGGFLANLLFDDTSIGIVGATIGSIIALLVYRAVSGHSERTA
jgi:uncharacterized membrane protein YeaQ/YmgE (transglycosylase-associated protein family)